MRIVETTDAVAIAIAAKGFLLISQLDMSRSRYWLVDKKVRLVQGWG